VARCYDRLDEAFENNVGKWVSHSQGDEIRAGFNHEAWHKHTYDANAKLQGKQKSVTLAKNNEPQFDMTVTKSNGETVKYQAKAYGDGKGQSAGQKTVKDLTAKRKNGKQKYPDDVKLLASEDAHVQIKSDPNLSAKDPDGRVCSRIAEDGIESEPITQKKLIEKDQQLAQQKGSVTKMERAKVVGKAALVVAGTQMTVQLVLTMTTEVAEAYRRSKCTTSIDKLKDAFSVLARSDTWKQIMVAVGTAGAVGGLTGLLAGLAEAFSEHSHIFNGLGMSAGALMMVGVVAYQMHEISKRDDLSTVAMTWEVTKCIGQLGVGVAGGMAGAAAGSLLLAGVPGMILGGILGGVLGGACGYAFGLMTDRLDACLQFEDRSALEVLGCKHTNPALYRAASAAVCFWRPGWWSRVTEAWAGDQDTDLLRVLQDPAKASESDRYKAIEYVKRQYRHQSLLVHPDRAGGSPEDFRRLEECKKALVDRLTLAADCSSAGPSPGPSCLAL
jgi:hypothetical protein